MTTATGMGRLPEMLEARAGSRAVTRAFCAAGLPEELVGDRAHRVPLPALVALFAHAGRFAGDRVLGLDVGLDMELEVFGRWMNYGMGAPTLQAGVARLNQALALHQTGCSLSIVRRGAGEFAFHYETPACARCDAALHSDHVVPIMVKFVQHFAGSDWLPRWVEVNYPADVDATDLVGRLPVEWRFGGAVVSIGLEADVPGRTSPTTGRAPGDGLTFVDLIAAEEVRVCSSAVHAIRATVALGLLDGRHALDDVAARLDISVRSVQRALDAAGACYRIVLDDVRRAKAQELLADTTNSVSDIAFVLHYNDPANFTRAFRRWTGQTPGDFRSQRAGVGRPATGSGACNTSCGSLGKT